MKILLVILTALIILISIFLINLNRETKLRRYKREMILNPRIKKPKVRVVSFADEIIRTMPVKQPWCGKGGGGGGGGEGGGLYHLGSHGSVDSRHGDNCVEPILIDEYGKDQLLNFDSFVDNYYSQKDITKFKQVYEAEALSIDNKHKLEDFVYKKESDRFQFQ